jgi:hypothetical protein
MVEERKRLADALLRAETELWRARAGLDRDQELNSARTRYAAARDSLAWLESEAARVSRSRTD